MEGCRTGEDVRELVSREIADDWLQSNLHGCDLCRCLVPPELREYDNCGLGGILDKPPPKIAMWVVLEEKPGKRSGYKIVFGKEAGMFGLAVPGTPNDIFVGFYGSFLETFRGM